MLEIVEKSVHYTIDPQKEKYRRNTHPRDKVVPGMRLHASALGTMKDMHVVDSVGRQALFS